MTEVDTTVADVPSLPPARNKPHHVSAVKAQLIT